MRRIRAFTLIELLVVISIIALLLSILMPALARVKSQGAALVCQAQLKQWGLLLRLYTSDYKSSYLPGPGGSVGEDRRWMELLMPYYATGDNRADSGSANKIRHCPKSKGTLWDAQGQWTGDPQPFTAWGIFPSTTSYQLEGQSGSYGLNWWLCNPKDPVGGTFYPKAANTHKLWRKVESVRTPDSVPAFCDASWYGFWVEQYNLPPERMDDTYTAHYVNNIKTVCVNRHDKYTEMVFADGSAKKVPLKKLWNFKWHKTYNTSSVRNGKPFPTFSSPVQGEWMSGFPDN